MDASLINYHPCNLECALIELSGWKYTSCPGGWNHHGHTGMFREVWSFICNHTRSCYWWDVYDSVW